MGVKSYLSQVKTLKVLADFKERQVQDLREKAEGLRSACEFSERVRVSSQIDALEKAICRLLEACEEAKEVYLKLIGVLGEIERIIGSIEDVSIKQVMALRYLESKRFRNIAEDMNYSEIWVMQLHNRGLRLIEQFLKEHSKT